MLLLLQGVAALHLAGGWGTGRPTVCCQPLVEINQCVTGTFSLTLPGLSCIFKLDTENLLGDKMHRCQYAVVAAQASLLCPCLGSGFDKLHSGITQHHRSALGTGALAASCGGNHKQSKAITVRDSYGTR